MASAVEEAFRSGLDARIEEACQAASTVPNDALPDNLEELLREMDDAAKAAQVAERKSLQMQEQLKQLFLQHLVQFANTPPRERLDQGLGEEDVLISTDVTSVSEDDETLIVLAERERPKTKIKSIVNFCLSADPTTSQFGEAHLETRKILDHFCTHAFVALWDAHLATHLFTEGFATLGLTDAFKRYKEISYATPTARRSWLVNQYIRHCPKLPEIHLPDEDDTLDKVKTLNALTYERNTLRDMQNQPVQGQVMFRIAFVIERERGGEVSGGYYDFNPHAFLDKDSHNGRINVACLEDRDLNAAYASNVDMKRWYIVIMTDEGFVAVPASTLQRAFRQFCDPKGRKMKFVKHQSLLQEKESQVFVHVTGGRYAYMSTIDTVIVDNKLEKNIFMNTYDETNSGVHCGSKLWIYDDARYCLPKKFREKRNELLAALRKEQREPPNPKLRGTTHLAERVCEFYRPIPTG